MDRNERIGAAFEKLFRTYKQSQAGDPEAVIREWMERAAVYFEAVSPYDVLDIEQAVKNLLSGTAPGHNPSYVPPAPVVASEARRVMNLRVESEARERRLRPQLPPPDVVHSPESRARIAALAQSYVATVANQMRTEDAERDRSMSALSARTNARFQPDMSETAMRRRLGYSAGDPDGDREVA